MEYLNGGLCLGHHVGDFFFWGGRIGVCNLCCTILEIYIFLVLFYQSVGACLATIGSSEGVKRNTGNDILGHTRDYVSIFNPRISVSHLHRSELDYQQTACTVARPIIPSNPTNQIKNQDQKKKEIKSKTQRLSLK